MVYDIRYERIRVGKYNVFVSGVPVGVCVLCAYGWIFYSFEDPVFVSAVPAHTRFYALVQWPGFRSLADLSAASALLNLDVSKN